MNEAVGWSAIVLASLSLAGNVVTTVVGRLGKKDKLQFDAEFQGVKNKLLTTTNELGEVRGQQADCEQKGKELAEKIVRLVQEIAGLKARDAKDRTELETQINTLAGKISP